MMRRVTTARALLLPSTRPSSSLPTLSSPQLEQQEPPAPPSSRSPGTALPLLRCTSPLQAAVAIANRGLRFGLNAWVERSAELSRRRALLRSVTPEARAVRGFNSWCAMLDAYAHLLYATRDARHREVFVALNTAATRAKARGDRALMTRAAAALRARAADGSQYVDRGGGREDGAPRAAAQHDAEGAGDAPRAQQLDGAAHVAAAAAACSSALINRGMRRGWLRWRAVAADGRKRRARDLARAQDAHARGARDAPRAQQLGSAAPAAARSWRRGAMASSTRASDVAQRLDRGRGGAAGGARALRRAGAAVPQRRERLAFNSWLEEAAERSRRRGIVRSMMPKARAMRRALNSWREMATNRRTALKLDGARGRSCAGAGSVWR